MPTAVSNDEVQSEEAPCRLRDVEVFIVAQVQQGTQGRHESSHSLHPRRAEDWRHAVQLCSGNQGSKHRLLRSELQAEEMVEVVAMLLRVRR